MPTVLIAEEDRLLRSAVAAYLNSHGYAVLEAGDPTTALNYMRQAEVDALLLDIHLNSYGVDLLKYMRNHEVFAQIPVVAIVACDYNIETLDYLAPGDYLHVPFDMAFLNWVLQKLLAENARIEE